MPAETQSIGAYRQQLAPRAREGADSPAARIALLAKWQHGQAAHDQLRVLGLSPNQISRRKRSGHLHRVFMGVYSVGHPPLTRESRWMAAALRGGTGAALTHHAAAALKGLRESNGSRIDITAPRRIAPEGSLRCHRVELPRDELTIHRGIPVTVAPRTLLDLASVLDADQIARAISETLRLGLTAEVSIPDVIARYPGRRGVAVLREAWELAGPGAGLLESELERDFWAAVRRSGLPAPERARTVEVRGRRFRLDFCWPRALLVVETDGLGYHATPARLDADRERDRLLALEGWTVIRLTARQLSRDRQAVLAQLGELIAARSGSRTSAPPST